MKHIRISHPMKHWVGSSSLISIIGCKFEYVIQTPEETRWHTQQDFEWPINKSSHGWYHGATTVVWRSASMNQLRPIGGFFRFWLWPTAVSICRNLGDVWRSKPAVSEVECLVVFFTSQLVRGQGMILKVHVAVFDTGKHSWFNYAPTVGYFTRACTLWKKETQFMVWWWILLCSFKQEQRSWKFEIHEIMLINIWNKRRQFANTCMCIHIQKHVETHSCK